MSPLGQLYVHDLPAPPGVRNYTLAIRCGLCRERVIFRSPATQHSPRAALIHLHTEGWRYTGAADGYICEACVRREHERALMGETAHV